MLQTVRNCIENLPEEPFADFYQDYVQRTQDRILARTIAVDSMRFTSLEDMNTVLESLNTMTEELKRL